MEKRNLGLVQEIRSCREDEPIYPNDLKTLKDYPRILYYKGNIEI